MDPNALLVAINTHQWLLVSAIIIGGVVRLLKGDTPLPMVPPRWRPWLALGLGIVSGVLQNLVQHVPLEQALLQGIVAGATAIVGHETIVESLLGGKELGTYPPGKLPPSPPSPPPS